MKTIILLSITYLIIAAIYIKSDIKPWPIRVIDGKQYEVIAIHGQEVLKLIK